MLNRLRKANNLRSIDWMGQKPGVDDLLFCAVELGGECGEAQDAIKKYSRFLQGVAGGVGPEQSKVDIAEELADTIISADRVASVMGIDLSAAIEDKFDKTSKKHNFKFMAEYLASYEFDPQVDYHTEFCQMEQEAQRFKELAETLQTENEQLKAKNRELAYQLFNQNGAIDAAVYGGKLSDTGFIRAFWRRIFVYRNDFEKELPKELPVEFAAAFETAAILLRKPSDREPEIGGPK